MHDLWNRILLPPELDERGDYFCGCDRDGDPFDEADAEIWRGGRFERALTDHGYFAAIIDRIAPIIANSEDQAFVEVACGPGMGLAPSLLDRIPDARCLATDASSLVIREWRRFIDSSSVHKSLTDRISLAQCSLLDLPFADESVSNITGFLAIGSTRSGYDGQDRAISEIYRALKPGGRFFTVENRWVCKPDEIAALFAELGKPIWQGFEPDAVPIGERLYKRGFTVEEIPVSSRAVKADDNELGELAVRRGVKITLDHTLYICTKYNLKRFLDAHAASYADALSEIRAGYKRSHWMWYIFPQLSGLGRSTTSQHYGISGLDEAKAYITEPTLRAHMIEITQALLALDENDPVKVLGAMGYVDAKKLRSSMTLFELAAPELAEFSQVLDKFFGGRRDGRTISIL